MINHITILREAIIKVPFVKYALGIAGIAAAIEIIKSFGINNYNVPIISILVMLGFMVLLFVFSALTKSKEKPIKIAGYTLIYTTGLVTCVSSMLLATSVFFDYPKPINSYGIFKTDNNNENVPVFDLNKAVIVKTDTPSSIRANIEIDLINKIKNNFPISWRGGSDRVNGKSWRFNNISISLDSKGVMEVTAIQESNRWQSFTGQMIFNIFDAEDNILMSWMTPNTTVNMNSTFHILHRIELTNKNVLLGATRITLNTARVSGETGIINYDLNISKLSQRIKETDIDIDEILQEISE